MNLPTRESLGAAIGGALDGFGGYLRCRECGHSQELGNPGERVTRTGWPQCCTYTMEWITQRQIDSGERPARVCGTVIGEQGGEPVFCGAIEAVHGKALGMVGGHDFDAASRGPA